MNDKFIRQFLAFMGTLICGLVFWAGYLSAQHGWWWTAFGLVVIYVAVLKFVSV